MGGGGFPPIFLSDSGVTLQEREIELRSRDIHLLMSTPMQWITFRVSPRLTEDLNSAAKILQTPRSRLIRTILRDGLAQLQEQGLTPRGLA